MSPISRPLERSRDMSDNYHIDKDVPMPPHSASRNYPFYRMEIGDSVFIAGKTPAGVSSSMAFQKPKKFRSRSEVKDNVKGVRVWRVS